MKKHPLLYISIAILVLTVFFAGTIEKNIRSWAMDRERKSSEAEKSAEEKKWKEFNKQNETQLLEDEKKAKEQEEYLIEWEQKSREKCEKVEQDKNPGKSLSELETIIEKCIVEVMDGTYQW